MSATYIVRGAATDKAYPRLEIADLVEQPMQFSLFIQAMTNLAKKDYDPVAVSMQELGGIHGLPYSRWSGDPAGPDEPESKEWGGYCYHSTTLFPTWHRVLMMALEQAVSNEAISIYKKTIEHKDTIDPSEKPHWLAAANALRFPYWDWSAHRVGTYGVPLIFTDNELAILMPGTNKYMPHPNPLQTYVFKPIPEGADKIPEIPWLPGVDLAHWTQTYRWATSKENPVSDVPKLNSVIRYGLAGETRMKPVNIISEKLAKVFSPPPFAEENLHPTYWDWFATTGPQAPEPYDYKRLCSLEEPHNKLHLSLGGQGHMAYNELAAFDPIFYMHHCNIDRLQALWEYCYPKYWMGQGYYKDGKLVPFKSGDGTWQQGKDTSITSQTSLAPFRKDPNTYWNSDDVRLKDGLRNLHYTYQPLTLSYQAPFSPASHEVTIDITKPPTEEHRLECIAAIQGFYTSLSVSELKPGSDVFAHASLQPSLFSRVNVSMPAPSTLALAPNTPLDLTHAPAQGHRVFVVHATLPQYAFRGSHRLELFVGGEFAEDLSVFSRLLPENCANCAGRIDAGHAFARASLTIPQHAVESVLTAAGLNTADASDEAVIKAVADSISARTVTPDGTVLAEAKHVSDVERVGKQDLSEDRLPSLQLHSAHVIVPKDETLAQWFAVNWVDHGEVLKNNWTEV